VEVKRDITGNFDPVQRAHRLPQSHLKGQANVLIFPNLDAANIACESIRVLAEALPVAPILIGAAKPVHVVTASTTARGIVNMTAVAAVEAQGETREQAAAAEQGTSQGWAKAVRAPWITEPKGRSPPGTSSARSSPKAHN
jgi:hypothetical protein